MAIQFNCVSSMLILVLLSISSVEGQRGGGGGVIDVVVKFGAKADEKTDLTTLDGPCKAPIELQVEGTVKAPADPGAFKEPKWIAFNRIENFKLFSGGLFDGQGTTAYKREVFTPDESLNTDGIHIGRSDGVNVLNSEIKTSDDCVSIGDGSKNLVINGVTCGPGHGISIGSLRLFKNEEPVDGVIVKNCTLTNTSNGVRIKTWPGAEPGTCLNIHFEDITVTNVSSPIIIDQKYCPWNKCKINEESKVKLSNISLKNIHGTSALPEAIKIICSATLPCENVELADIEITHSGPTGPAVSQCSNVKPKVSGKQNPAPCSAPIPAKPTPAA
ncbi:hypothetical protein Gotur_003138 [Gossypium turneri]